MNPRTLALASMIVAAVGTAAFAEETVGRITALDNATGEVTLDDGYTYALVDPECSDETLCPLEFFKPGDTVRIVWHTQQDARVVTEMAVVDE
jgi:hypothetical protein